MVKYPTFPRDQKLSKKNRKKIVSDWKAKLPPAELDQVLEGAKKHSAKGSKRFRPDPVEETPRGFTKEEIRKIDWDNT